MPAFLKFIDVENFKSYRGRQRIGPLESFTAVVGPNDLGKSHFMDAVSFVMGKNTSFLCVKRLGDLIHGASRHKPVSKSASVTATFVLEDTTEKQFQRSVLGQSSEHKVDGQSVSVTQYLAELEKLAINAKPKNFLMFRGAIESIAMKNPKERTSLFEEISGSGILKEQYEACHVEVKRADLEAHFSYYKIRNVVAERKEAKLEQEEAEKYTRLKEELCVAGPQRVVERAEGDPVDPEAGGERGGALQGRRRCDTESDSSSLSTTDHYQKESSITVDYGSLSEALREPERPDEIERRADKPQKGINELQDTVDKIQAPNMRAMQRLNAVDEKLRATNEAFVAARKRRDRAKLAFEKVKKERYDKFMHCFEYVINEINAIYKALTMNQSAQAFLWPENGEEPYLGGMNYDCSAAGERSQPTSSPSGAEHYVAALALLFALHSYQPAPFFLLDEIDAALDNTNISTVASYIRSKRGNLQTFVVSLKEEFYGCADALVGIYCVPADCLVSEVMNISLQDYRQ